MLVASFVAGCVPLATKLSDSKLKMLTSVSVGLLISTSLVVIIPEGVETLYSNNPTVDTHSTPAEIDTGMANHSAVGLSLLIGFVVMFIIDSISSLHVHAGHHPAHDSDDERKRNRNSTELDAILSADNNQSNTSEQEDRPTTYLPNTSLTTPTIGLIVHAAADGIALGASASHPQLSMVVFLAIMLHKAPSAFALTTVLLSEGLSRTKVRQHLFSFSIAAPTGAILTYLFLHIFSDSFTMVNLEYWTGILLLFSGGTFLYVAMHAIQELPKNQHEIDWKQMLSILLGMFIPSILNLNHSH
ncbi:Zinc/iron permease [Pilobolus umbonatus]|nr:Zinc/iron permease [Pilobolus umbonatus]